ncbi:MAG TPA: thiamine pyrophosphate-dependent dehydrogenase E1 component subunit alpha [Solirubrobacteraceae bacterium]|jgi:TPP-dependent pyruvate/acetoin dehydrogenase alpha subunit|nr:thiamine pyrophosphate-dependent dehydrogenase E1 component subunit alpha [Solirubrobacteraceae bacterium]
MAHSTTELTDAVDAELGLELYERMALIRRFEDAVQALFQKGEVHGTTHLYSGQEAGAVGVCSVLTESDRAAGTYRGHGHALALGVDPQALMAELLGRETGVCRGRAGSMNVIDLAHGLIGCFGIVGGSIAAATGAALAFQRRGSGDVAVAFFGEGTSNQAYFAECLNFTRVLGLPAVFVCENNRYMEFTPIEDVTAGEIRARAETLGLWAETVDGMDVWAVREAAQRAVEHARSGGGPAFLETLTYRFVGHSRSDPGAYRKAGELDEMRKRDPLVVARERLSAAGVKDAQLDAVDAHVAERMAQVTEAALAAPFPAPDSPASEYAP